MKDAGRPVPPVAHTLESICITEACEQGFNQPPG
jgi:hypothetical protein